MELEPITRKEKIIAGENLEPITRLEKFLKEYGGSGGSGGGGSTDAVLYTAQTLTDAQKKQARQNIDAAIADFVVNGTMGSDGTVTLNKTFAQIQASVQDGKRPVLKLSASGVAPTFIPLVSADTTQAIFTALTDVANGGITTISVIIKSAGDVRFIIAASPASNSDGTMPQFPMASDPTSPMQIATKKYVDDRLSGSPITIKLGTGNAATSTATFAEIKAALEAGKAPILDSATGNNHWFALNWMLSGSDRLSIQYGTFNVEGGGMANFTFYDVGVSSTGITYTSRQFTSQ